MASALMTQMESFIKTAESVEPKGLLKLEEIAEKTAPVREKYVSNCSKVEEQLQDVLHQIRGKSPDPNLEAKLAQAIGRLEELKKPYV